jgi:hypothetical protein
MLTEQAGKASPTLGVLHFIILHFIKGLKQRRQLRQ